MQDDPKITARKGARKGKEAAEDAAGLTIAERLTRASKEVVVKVPISYSGGDFDIEVRLAMVSEQQAIRQLSKTTSGNVIKPTTKAEKNRIDKAEKNLLIKAEKELAEMFASHSIDESLDFDFWMRADFSPDIFQRILYAILGLSADQVQKAQEVIDAKSFRQD